ncbi:hypothetical protein AVEN_92115-1 [Araneus ventricosus]|uniref:Uncharacterized protein n=1 Tax=Araneus ventricosus TaxID=182803 RepID=A0A4Y2LDZ7_ARAVE|nr:hypothetical protein AVEN_92115-1 [Araneus ventricosus]
MSSYNTKKGQYYLQSDYIANRSVSGDEGLTFEYSIYTSFCVECSMDAQTGPDYRKGFKSKVVQPGRTAVTRQTPPVFVVQNVLREFNKSTRA